MADRLVKCQLIRAQEAETTIALRCELSILRREYANLNSNSNLITNEFSLNINNNNKSIENNDEQDKLLLVSIYSIFTSLLLLRFRHPGSISALTQIEIFMWRISIWCPLVPIFMLIYV
ncbi:unnamed protein product [Schistosoma mattheei]|uniref:Uncharacterized protein n=1 Tax=Schistosoma mattheei TaxID=31246 RepID=A0A183Q2C9_9TREM|nr:unnamed protein product [Schistosoma mattheei]